MELIEKYFPELKDKNRKQLAQLAALYQYWNDRINVISRKDMGAFYERHVLHSLSIAKLGAVNNNMNIVDIGTGGGFPGIPLSILYPKAHFVLIDSRKKKIKVVNEVLKEIDIRNVTGIHGRAEEFKAEKFDLAITRAVAPLKKLGQWARCILKSPNQGLICLKGGDLKTEIQQSELATKCWPIKDYFSEPFFETKLVTWSEVPV